MPTPEKKPEDMTVEELRHELAAAERQLMDGPDRAEGSRRASAAVTELERRSPGTYCLRQPFCCLSRHHAGVCKPSFELNEPGPVWRAYA
jgi:hypothetical protein